MRYTEARLAPHRACEMLRDLDADTVDFEPNYDGENAEPLGPAGALPEPARQRLVRHRRRHGDEHPAAQPARGRSPPRSPTSTTRTIDVDGLMQPHPGPGLPDRRHDPRPHRHPRRLRDRPRPGPRPRQARTSEPLTHGKEAIIVTELPYAVKKGGDGGADHEDRRPRPRQEDHRDLRPARRVRPQRHAARDRAQARRDPEGRAQQALQAHADAGDVRRQHGRAGRRRAADAVAARGHPALRPAPARGHRPPRQVRAAHARGARPPSSRAC